VVNVPYQPARIAAAIRRIWRGGRPVRRPRVNIYGAGGAGRKIAQILAGLNIDRPLLRKIISY
jgi:hypothetical protein